MHSLVPSLPLLKQLIAVSAREEVKNVGHNLAFYKIYFLLHVSAFETGN